MYMYVCVHVLLYFVIIKFFPLVAIPRLNGYYSAPNTGPVALHNLRCSGNEDTLLNCTSSTVPITTTHARDAGVYCYTNDSKC